MYLICVSKKILLHTKTEHEHKESITSHIHFWFGYILVDELFDWQKLYQQFL